MTNENLKMTFDQLQRYRLAVDLIEEVRRKKPLSILDAGSREGFLDNFLPGDQIIGIDRSDFIGDRFIKGDVLCLPFRDNSFDVVLTLDVLEHIAVFDRLAFIEELVRVSDDTIIIGAPFENNEVAEAEKLAIEFCEKMTGVKNEFLVEHLIKGLPDLGEIIAWAEDRGLPAVVLPNGYIYNWFLMICLNFYLAQIKDPWEFIFAVNQFYFNRFYTEDNREPSYRHFVVINKRGRMAPEDLAEKFIYKDSPVSIPDLGLVLEEINHILDFVYQEMISGLTEEKENLRLERDELIVKLETALAELNGIKSTIPYRMYKKTLGRLMNKSGLSLDDPHLQR